MKLFIFLLFFVIIIPSVYSFGKKEKNDPKPLPVETPDIVEQLDTGLENMKKLTGRVQIYGSEPRTFVGIVDEQGTEFAVYPPSQEEELRKLQGYLIEFTVIFLEEPQGNGSLYLKGGTVTPVKWEIIR